MYKRTTLNNGLTIATYHMPDRASTSLGIWIKVGARYEQPPINGISHFLEHLLFKGTQRRSCEEIKQAIEGIGGSLNAFTSEEVTCYLAKVPAKFLASALDVLWDMVLNARLDHSDVEMERKVILEEIRMYKDLPGHHVLDILTELLWPDQPLGMNIAGETQSVGSITREQIASYKQGFYRLNNIAVIGCGALKHQQLLQECKKASSNFKPGNVEKFVKAAERQTKAQTSMQFKKTEQTHLALGLHGLPRNHPRRFGLGLLHVILGANMSSRLFREVRETRGLAYEIGTAVKFLQDTGAFVVHAGVDNRRAPEAIAVILEQLHKIKKENVEEAELRRAKEYYTGQLMLALEGTSEHMFWLGENVTSLKKFLHPREIVKRIQSIQAGELKDLANKILKREKLNLALIGPIKEKEKQKIKGRLDF